MAKDMEMNVVIGFVILAVALILLIVLLPRITVAMSKFMGRVATGAKCDVSTQLGEKC